MRTIKMQTKQTLNWEDIQKMQQKKKSHKQFRAQRQSKKSIWQIAE